MANNQTLFKSSQGMAKYMDAYDAVLSLWSVPYETLEIPTKFGCTHVIASGRNNATPLILLHAANTSSTIWFPNIGELSQHYRTYALDILGNAGKSVFTHPMPTQSDCAEWLVQVFDALRIEKAHLAGLSYGGWIVLNFALHIPNRVSKAVLISPASPFVPFKQGFILRLLPSAFLPFHPVIAFGLRGMWSQGFRVQEEFMHQLVMAGKHCRLMQGGAGPFPSVFTDEELRRINTPILLLLGEQDITFDAHAAWNRAKNLLPNFEGEVLPAVGHALTMERSEIANARILTFLGDATASN